MPNTSGSAKKQRNAQITLAKREALKDNNESTSPVSAAAISPTTTMCSTTAPTTTKSNTIAENVETTTPVSPGTAAAGAINNGNRGRKRKRCELVQLSESDLESEFEDCNLEDAVAIENKLRKVARMNELTDGEMRMLLQKFVKNDHVLALISLKAEDALAREQREQAEQRAILITDTPSVAKLTRAKARELNRTPAITFPPLAERGQTEIACLIDDELHSDEDDEEYTFKEEDFISDDDPNMTNSDLDSNPRTPQTPLGHNEGEDSSPVKLTADGCFKIPLEKQSVADLRIATRTRSKLCLEQTTIEAIESEFVPPDVETQLAEAEADAAAPDEDWMEFLNDFAKPLNSSFAGDDDDLINDPEYVAADKVPVDAEELRDVNISKKELTELVAELFEGLLNEGVSLESIELETPQKFIENLNQSATTSTSSTLAPPSASSPAQVPAQIMPSPVPPLSEPPGTFPNDPREQATRRIDFNTPITSSASMPVATTTTTTTTPEQEHNCVSDATISSTNLTQHEYSFQPDVMSTPGPPAVAPSNRLLVPVAMPDHMGGGALGVGGEMNAVTLSPDQTYTIAASEAITDMIAIPIPGQPNRFQLAKIAAAPSDAGMGVTTPTSTASSDFKAANKMRSFKANNRPYDDHFTTEYISIRKHVQSEYMERFEALRHAPPPPPLGASSSTSPAGAGTTRTARGFTAAQHDILQQQLRLHVQFLTQNFIQSYCHPTFWRLAGKAREMLEELEQRVDAGDASFRAWNLAEALALCQRWEQELSEDTPENKDMMAFIHREMDATKKCSRQVPRFAPRILDFMLDSAVFLYPRYLPRIPFTAKACCYEVFAPAESQLLAMGLEKHMTRIRQRRERIPQNTSALRLACERTCRDTLFGKIARRGWKFLQDMLNADYYNPVKYFMDHNCAPPVDHTLMGITNPTKPLPPKDLMEELPLAWQKHVKAKLKKLTEEQSIAEPEQSTATAGDEAETPKSKRKASRPYRQRSWQVSDDARHSYLQFVREVVGDEVVLPPHLEKRTISQVPATPNTSTYNNGKKRKSHISKENSQTPGIPEPGIAISKRRTRIGVYPTSVTINVNYVFGGTSFNASQASGNGSLLNFSGASEGHLSRALLPPPPEEKQSLSVAALNSPLKTLNTPGAVNTPTSAHQPLCVSTPLSRSTPIAYNFDLRTSTLQPVLSSPGKEASPGSSSPKEEPKQAKEEPSGVKEAVNSTTPARTKATAIVRSKRLPIGSSLRRPSTRHNNFNIWRRDLASSLKYRRRQSLRKKCQHLLFAYQRVLDGHRTRFIAVPVIHRYYAHFKALELYTNLLGELAMFCRNAAASGGGSGEAESSGGSCHSGMPSLEDAPTTTEPTTTTMTTSTLAAASGSSVGGNSPGGCHKRQRENEDLATAARTKKATRQEENLRHMMLPEPAEDTNRKDAIFAFNFYEKVEEVLKSSSRPEDCRKFNHILKSFDPRHEKVADLYHKMEKLFLPDHPELAEVFLTFLLPSQAAEIGKFFEHFMMANTSTFINKLNVYFSKQPAQIRKIYNCLSELAESASGGVTVNSLEAKIVPLLKSNQFLLEWFMQQFPHERPPERLLPVPEHVSLKEVLSNQSGEFVENLPAESLHDSPTQDQQPGCQLRYINGRIFYGSKITLPAKLSFMAAQQHAAAMEGSTTTSSATATTPPACIHGIREHGEKRLAAAAAAAAAIQQPLGGDMANTSLMSAASEEHDKSEEEEAAAGGLVIDTTCGAGDDESCSSQETCDDATLRAHALRLNPGCYSNSCFSLTAGGGALSAALVGSQGTTSARRTTASAVGQGSGGPAEEGKVSPRKNQTGGGGTPPSGSLPAANSAVAAGLLSPAGSGSSTSPAGGGSGQSRDKRKSPVKKNRSPVAAVATPLRTSRPVTAAYPMVVIHEQQHSPAIACAKKLKSFIEEADSGGGGGGASPTPDNGGAASPSASTSLDSKDNVIIVALPKRLSEETSPAAKAHLEEGALSETDSSFSCPSLKQEQAEDMEFLPATPSPSPARTVMARQPPTTPARGGQQQQQQEEEEVVSSTHHDSDEDCKMDIVASLMTLEKGSSEKEAAREACAASASENTAVAEASTATPTKQYSSSVAWARDEDKTILIEMKLDSHNRDDLYRRIHSKLPARSLAEIRGRFYFLMDFLAKLTGK